MEKISINKLARENIIALQKYNSARDDFSANGGIHLDANENPYGKLNRYPDPLQKVLKQKLSNLKTVHPDNIFIGNGSDEVIDLVYRIFCNPQIDKVLAFSPTYGMYEILAKINDILLVNIPLDPEFQIDFDAYKKQIKYENFKVIFICSPNNPTGNNIYNIENILQTFKGIVILDEAYIDFSEAASFVTKIKKYNNLIIIQTFSKAFGIAGARIGVAYASKEIIYLMNKVKLPYNVSQPNQNKAIKALDKIKIIKKQVANILSQKKWLIIELNKLTIVTKIYPSDANFLLVETINADIIYYQLIKAKVIIRNRNSVVNSCIRVTIGTPKENKKLINELLKIKL
jgi:histidinol-phosphate aminotransferase